MRRILIIVAAVVVFGVFIVLNLKKSGGPKPSEVRLEDVETRTIVATVRAPGRVQPSEYVNLSAQVPGRIVELPVAEGDTVKSGDLLIRLDDTQYRAALESARAAAKSAESTVRLSEARVERSQQNLDRQKRMAEDKLVSPEAIEIAETDLKVTEAELAARRQDFASAQARVTSAADDLSKTVYRAPTAGIISALNVKLGEIVITGTMNNPGTVIMTIADQSRMQVEADVDETDVVDIRIGQPVKITVDAMPDTTFPGTVTQIAASASLAASATAESATNFQVKVLFDQDIRELRPGMTADVEITTGTHENVVAIPIAALVARDPKTLERQKKQYEDRIAAGKSGSKGKKDKDEADDEPADTRSGPVKLVEGVFVNRDGTAFFEPVQTGLSDDTHIEITGNVEPKQSIVTGPFQTLRELKYGAPIKPMKQGKKGKEKK